MMKNFIFTLAMFMCVSTLLAQTTVSGTITDETSKQPIPGVTIKLLDSSVGTTADFDGNFILEVPNNPPFSIAISAIGYAQKTVEISSKDQKVNIALTEATTTLDEVVVSASRRPERIMESPVTVEVMDIRDIQNTSAPTFYDGLENLKGVDINTNSLTNKSINTRGFATFANERFIQLVDGMDNSSPALNFALGNLLGMNELDVFSVEILPGTASALYGPNAFNGALFMTSKNPFDFTGVDAYAKSGMTSSSNAGDNIFYDFGFRAAHKFNDKFAIKASASFLKGTEWFATDYRDYAQDLTMPGSPTPILPETGQTSFDRLNVYGDEVTNDFDFSALGLGTQTVSRTGYREEDLTDYDAESLKGDIALHYRPNGDDLEIILNSKVGKGNTIYQGTNRYNIKNFLMFQHKIEVRNNNFFVRAYMTHEDAGDSYDMRFTGINMNKATAVDWFTNYGNVFAGSILGGADQVTAHELARADSDERFTPQPGTPEFDTLFKQVTEDPNSATGSKFQDKSKLYHTEGNYNFDHLIDWAEFQIGGSYRNYELNSGGTIFTDADGPINYGEYGIYIQMQKKFADDRLKFTGSIRYDKSQNFDGNSSPRVSLAYSAGENRNHNFRASFQTGFRNPTTQDQYIGFDGGRALLVGSAPDNLDRYVSAPFPTSTTAQQLGYPAALSVTGRQGYENSWSLNSVQLFSAEAAQGNIDPTLLQSGNVNFIKPEKVTAFELGYRGYIDKKFTIDLSGYYNEYEDFIGNRTVIAPMYGNADLSDITTLPPELGGPTPTALVALNSGDVKAFQLYTNSQADISSYGAAIEVGTKLWKGYMISANYTWAQFDFDQASDPDYQASFNTPEHKVKLGFGNPNVYKDLGFNVNVRWSDKYLWESTFANAIIDARTVIDAQVTYAIPKWKSTVKLGAANLGGEEYLVAPGNGLIGSQYFASWTFSM